MGKITNLLSSDVGVIEWRMMALIQAFSFPVYAIGTLVILVIRLGWPGLICMLINFLFFPLIGWISSINGNTLKEVNVYKDKRVQTTTEMI